MPAPPEVAGLRCPSAFLPSAMQKSERTDDQTHGRESPDVEGRTRKGDGKREGIQDKSLVVVDDIVVDPSVGRSVSLSFHRWSVRATRPREGQVSTGRLRRPGALLSVLVAHSLTYARRRKSKRTGSASPSFPLSLFLPCILSHVGSVSPSVRSFASLSLSACWLLYFRDSSTYDVTHSRKPSTV